MLTKTTLLLVENVDVLSYVFVTSGIIRINATWDVNSTESEVNYLTCISTAPLSEEPGDTCIDITVSELATYMQSRMHASNQFPCLITITMGTG